MSNLGNKSECNVHQVQQSTTSATPATNQSAEVSCSILDVLLVRKPECDVHKVQPSTTTSVTAFDQQALCEVLAGKAYCSQ